MTLRGMWKYFVLAIGLYSIFTTYLLYSNRDGDLVDPSNDAAFNLTFRKSFCHDHADLKDIPYLYIVTPTYKRLEQIADLTRLSQTLLHLPNLVWLVIEDAKKPTPEVVQFLRDSGVTHVYMRAEMPEKYNKLSNKPRGVANRNRGIEWIRDQGKDGVVFFADDDNTYDLRLFDEIRSTKKVSMFPVGLIGRFALSTPIVKDGKVVDYFEGWRAGRKFPVDMAGFAVTVALVKKYENAMFPFVVGYEETGFLEKLNITNSDIELKAENCTKIWAWHTQTKKNLKPPRVTLKREWYNSNLDKILKLVDFDSKKSQKP